MDMSILYEFIGTLAILYGAAKYSDALPIVLAIFVIAKTVTSGHLNPAITFFYYLSGKTDASTALMYMLSQFMAAFVVFIIQTSRFLC
jgi:glycerol uptake facilitator-like aquaporin